MKRAFWQGGQFHRVESRARLINLEVVLWGGFARNACEAGISGNGGTEDP
jgi:hypothetical protein